MRICVLGAGVAGATTALELIKVFKNVTIIADKFTDETLSNGAAGIFRPGSGFRGPRGEEKKWIADSYNYYNSLLNSSEADVAGVMSVSGYIFSSQESVTENKTLRSLLPVYRKVEFDEIQQISPNNGFKHGTFFETLVVECADFLPYAMEKFKSSGGKIERRRISSFSELEKDFDKVINCSGLNAKYLCNDEKVVPIRGQVFKVKAPWVKMFHYGDFDTYIIPGKRTVTLGGCRNFDSYNTSVDKHDSASIYERCCKLLPALKECQVVKEWVGLRPYRDTVRVEADQQNQKIFHNYGHGGYGVTSAPGTAKAITEILIEKLKKENNFNELSKL